MLLLKFSEDANSIPGSAAVHVPTTMHRLLFCNAMQHSNATAWHLIWWSGGGDGLDVSAVVVSSFNPARKMTM